jgi:hypothetical protein
MKVSSDSALPLASRRPQVYPLHTFSERSTDGVTIYLVRLMSDGTWSCQCKGFHYTGHCRHIGKNRISFLGS